MPRPKNVLVSLKCFPFLRDSSAWHPCQAREMLTALDLTFHLPVKLLAACGLSPACQKTKTTFKFSFYISLTLVGVPV